MNIFILLIALSFIPKWNSKTTAKCPQWSWNSGISQNKQGNERICATKSKDSNDVYVESCYPLQYYCNINFPLTSDVKWTQHEVVPWKINLPAGDACSSFQECQTQRWNKTQSLDKATCQGIPENKPWKVDNEWYPGLFWFIEKPPNGTCTQIRKIGDTCDPKRRWEFGSLWANNIWVRYGTLIDGTRYNLSDSELIPNSTLQEPWMYRVCKTFTGFNTSIKSEGDNFLLECGSSPKLKFGKYERDIEDDQLCDYIQSFPNGTSREFTFPTQWGYSGNGMHYCPMMRTTENFTQDNAEAISLWSTTRPCHHRSTIQYWRYIIDDDILRKAYNKFLFNEWVTTKDNYAKIAGVQDWVGNNILEIKNYWSLTNSSKGNWNAILAVLGIITIYINFI